jgi:hypothetical protein
VTRPTKEGRGVTKPAVACNTIQFIPDFSGVSSSQWGFESLQCKCDRLSTCSRGASPKSRWAAASFACTRLATCTASRRRGVGVS